MERFSEEFVLCTDIPDVISDNGLSNMPEVMWDAFLCGIYRMKRIENYRRLSHQYIIDIECSFSIKLF